jgi:adenine/guanine/hypoxanthine permease
MKWIDSLFKLRENRTTFCRECVAGLTTFAAMAYILAVNPVILEAAGMDRGAALTSTALAAALGCLLIALLTNYPIAQAPGMGLNAFFAYTICIGMGVPWQAALGLVFYSGILFLLLAVSGVRQKIIEAIPAPLKTAVACGIGLFIAFLGMKNAGLVAADPVTMVRLGDLSSAPALTAFAAIILTATLIHRKIPGAALIVILGVTAACFFLPNGNGGTVATAPDALFALPASLAPVFFALDLGYLWNHFPQAFPVVIALLFVDVFDSMGTFVGVCQRGGFTDDDGNIPRIKGALMADATASIAGATLGTSTVTAYIESAAGVEAGGRTGLTACVVALCFLASLFFAPVLLAIPALATGPVLIVVGIFMMQEMRSLPFHDWVLIVPAMVIIMGIPFTFSITDGIGFGFIVYAGLMIATGRIKELHPIVLRAVFGISRVPVAPGRARVKPRDGGYRRGIHSPAEGLCIEREVDVAAGTRCPVVSTHGQGIARRSIPAGRDRGCDELRLRTR